MVRFGIGPAAWGVRRGLNPLGIHWNELLDQVAHAGYDGVELGTLGYLPKNPDQLREELNGRRLSLAAGQLNAAFTHGEEWEAVRSHAEAILNLLNAIGSRNLILLGTYTARERIVDLKSRDDRWSRLIERILEIGKVAADRGVLAAYHPHAGGPIESEEEIGRFLSDTDQSLVSLCFDTGHHAYCGGNVPRFIRQHADRISYVHLKNIDTKLRDRAVSEGMPFGEAVALGVVTDLESGSIDFRAVRDVLQSVAFNGWVVVEQDMNPSRADAPAQIASRNREYLRALQFSG